MLHFRFLFPTVIVKQLYKIHANKQYDQRISKHIKLLLFSRHEVPVTSQPITIVHMDDDIVVVNKPASIPVSGLNDRHLIYFDYYYK